MMDVFRKIDGVETVVCRLSEKNAKLSRECMGRDEVTVQVTVDEVLPVQEMDYIRVDGGVYTLNRMTDYDEVSEVEYRYNLMFEGVIYNLMDKMYVNTPTNSDKFYLTATLAEFTALLAENMNTVDAGWSVGDVPETDRKNLQFESVSCREALNRLAGEFGVEFYLEERRICFTERIEHHTSLVFERGKGKGLYKVTCKNADSGNTVTRVRVYGSGDNLPIGYRGGQVDRLQLPMEGGKPVYYLEDFSEFKKVVEKTVHFDDVKPSFTGVVAQVGGEYNRQFTCPEIDFDLNGVAVGDNARVNFLTGDLTGVSFAFQWDNARKEMNLVRQEDSMALPDADGKRVLIPHEQKKAKAGDRFNFTGISLPQAYVDRAEGDLLAKGREWLSFYKQLRVNFGLDVDYRYLREKGYALNVGDVVTVKIPKLKIEKQLRVLSVEKDLNTGRVSCNVSNYITESWEKRIEGQIQSTQSNIDRVNLSVNYLVEASKEWVARHFSRLAGGNRFTGKQVIDGDVELEADRRLNLGGVVLARVADVFRTVLSVSGKDGGEVEVSAAGVRAKRVTTEEVSTPDFVSGLLGEGTRLKDNHLELDEITVRRRMNVHELMIEKVRSVGGSLILSPGAAKIAGVTESGDVFRCTFDNDGGAVENPFEVGDQVYCQAFNGGGIKRYWRLVVAVGTGYFDLSRTDCEAGSAAPEAGDEVVLLGNRTDAARQNALILCAVGADAPYTDQYAGINGFSLAGKLITREGNLSGIVDEALGQLSGSGLYAKNVYLRGKLALSSGKTVETVLGEVDAKADNAQSTGESAQQTASNAAAEVAKAKTELTNVTSDVKLLADAQKGFSVTVTEVREKAEAAQSVVDNLQIGGVNLLDNSDVERTSVNEYLSYTDMTSVFDKNGVGVYTISFDIKANKNSKGMVYFMPGESTGFKYKGIPDSKTINSTTNYTRHYITTEISVCNPAAVNFPLSFYFTYGTGAILSVKNVKIERGNKASGWTPSVADVQKKIDLAQTAANEAKARLTVMSNDGVISKEEKATLRNDKAQIDREFNKYKEDATTYGVSITALLTAYNALVGFLATTVKIADNTDCTFGAGEKDMYNYRFAAYYSARSAFANLIATKVAARAVDGIEVGGVNLCDNFKAWIVGGVTANVSEDGNSVVLALTNINADGAFASKKNIERKGNYVCSVDVETSGETKIYIDPRGVILKSSHEQYRSGVYFTLPAGFKERIVIYANSDTVVNANIYVGIAGGSRTKSCKFAYVQLEIGNKATSWTSSMADQKAQYDAVVLGTEQKSLGQSWASGKMLYDDPTFNTGVNSISIYSWSGNVTLNRIPKLPDSPVRSEYNIEIKNIGNATPGLGGFSFNNMSRANAVFICRFIAKIPLNYKINFASNQIGDAAYHFWATGNKGTGNWEEYIYVLKCGRSGTFSTTNYYFLERTSGAPELPVTWYLAYASVFDVTDGMSMAKQEADKGKLFLRGAGIFLPGERQLILNNSGVSIATPGRGLNLIVIRRSDFAILSNVVYDTCGNAADSANLATFLNALDNSVIVTLTSWDEAGSLWTQALSDAIARCGGSGVKPGYRVPYAFLGIPGIGKGNGIEVFTSAVADAPYAEILTQVINGMPMGMSGQAATVKTVLEASIETKAGKNELTVIEENYNALGKRVTSAETIIKQTAHDISLLVKDATSESGMVIKPDKIEISGATVFRDTSNNQTFSVFGSGGYALNLNNKFKVTTFGKLYATEAEISGRITSSEGKIGGFTIGANYLENAGLQLSGGAIIYNDSYRTARFGIYTASGYPAINYNIYIKNNAASTKAVQQVCAYFERNTQTVEILGGTKALQVAGSVDITGITNITGNIVFDVSGTKMSIKGLPSHKSSGETDSFYYLGVHSSTNRIVYIA